MNNEEVVVVARGIIIRLNTMTYDASSALNSKLQKWF